MEHKVKNGNVRIDTYLSKLLDLSRNKISKANIIVNGKKVKSSYIVKEDDIIEIPKIIEEEIKAEPEKMDLDIIYEDDDVIVINKENGMVVHPAVGNTKHTLVNGLLYYSNKLSNNNGQFRPGIVHRIDAYTTGLLMIAKNDKAHDFLAKQLSEKTTHRKYIALVWGVINNDTGTIDAPIGRDVNDRKKMSVVADGKEAITHFEVIERYKNATLIALKLETGRTHQIRVHLNYINHPVTNDPVYGNHKKVTSFGQMLHSKSIRFIHPVTKKELYFEQTPPQEFLDYLEAINIK